MPPVNYRAGRGSPERMYQIAMDWSRKFMQIAAVATLLLYGYLLYALLFGAVGQWGTLPAAEHARLLGNVRGAVQYAGVALGVLLLTACILYYDEEAFGYVLVGGALALYYGVPFLFDAALSGQMQQWQKEKNEAALAIYNQIKLSGLMMAIPGGILMVRDLVLRVVDGSQRKKNDFSGMQYGGNAVEEAPVSKPIIGIVAKCWQLTFCRDAIRKNCPIFHHRTRCWRERVGCMCEEKVIRQAMDSLINKDTSSFNPFASDPEPVPDPLIEGFSIASFSTEKKEEEKTSEKTVEFPVQTANRPPARGKEVKIPHNPNLPMRFKVERCQNCVIYNEHQRLKYQFFAPLTVLVVPALTFFNFSAISGGLDSLLRNADKVMARLSPLANPNSTGLASSLTGNEIPKFIVIGCLVVIATTMTLRFLEYCVFKLKI